MKKYDLNVNVNVNGFEVAVIGMACRLPGAKDINEYLNILKNGECSIKFYTKDEMRRSGIPDETINNPFFINAGTVIDDYERFDANFWNCTPHTAQIMSWEHKIALEEVWAAFENAGYNITENKKKIGVFFSGGFINEAFNDSKNTANHFELLLATGADFLSTRIAYELGLTGPAINIQTACSSSLVSIHYACQSLLNGECSMAVAGGITIDPPRMGYFYEEGMIYSKDGYCKSFDNESTGTIFSSGCGCVVLKPLEDALRDSDRIDAIIRGSSVNNDGRRKMGFIAPSEEGQFKAIAQAINSSEIGSEEIGYIECHGTGTKIGDAIEINALTRALEECRKSNTEIQCAIGSVKSNIGHTQGAAGVAGFIKTVLSLKNALIFPSLHYENTSPRIDNEQSLLFVNSKLSNWNVKNGSLRFAGVSSFGAGGTNAHIVLSEMPKLNIDKLDPPYPYSIISLSAKSPKSLEMMKDQLASFLKNNQKNNLTDISYMLHAARAQFNHRYMIVSANMEDAAKKIEASLKDGHIDITNYYDLKNETKLPIVFLCSGIGEHYFNMTKELYASIPYYREQINLCCNLLKPYLENDLLQLLFSNSQSSEFEDLLQKTEYMVPAVFTVGYAMAKLLMYWGINPQILIGHSTGEYLAACLANVLPLKDMLHLVVRRAQIIDSLPSGAMIVVPLAEQEIKPFLNEEISIAAVNAPSFCTLSGNVETVKKLVDKLSALGIASKYLPVKHAYHSKMMELAEKRFIELFSLFNFKTPSIPYISNLTGKLITPAEVIDPYYWFKHTRDTVCFSQGMQNLFEKDFLYIEIGPGNNLVSAVLQHQTNDIVLKDKVFSTIRAQNKGNSDLMYFFNAIGKVWLRGIDVDWVKFYGYNLSCRVELPTYKFDKSEYLKPQDTAIIQPAAMQETKLPIDDWFYAPLWQRSPLHDLQSQIVNKKILIFNDNCGIGDTLTRILQNSNDVYKVTLNTTYGYDPVNKEYSIAATVKDDYEKIFVDLTAKQVFLDHVIHLWGVEQCEAQYEHEVTKESIEKYQNLGFYSVLFLVQAIRISQIRSQINLTVIANGVYAVTGDEILYPEKATLQGLIKCIPHEYSQIVSKYIDIDLNANSRDVVINDLIAECLSNKHVNDLIAYRNSDKFILNYENIKLPMTQGVSKNLKSKGTYLITGGLGGIGFTLAEYLAKYLKANLILTYRTPLPEKVSWDDCLSNPESDSAIAEKIRRVLRLESLGVTVTLMQADVCDYVNMQEVKEFIYLNYIKLDGIIHCAGITAGQFILNKDKEYSDNIFRPKLQGSLNLLQIFGSEDIDFMLFTSSILSIDCFMGQADYSGANAFLDAFGYYCSKRAEKHANKPMFQVVNWDGWQEIGGAAREQENVAKKRLETLNFNLKKLNCYLFTTQISENNGNSHYYISSFTPREHWFLSEHKLGGMPAVPGTLYLELLECAARFSNLEQPIYIENLKFITPLRVSINESKEVFTTLNKVSLGIDVNVFTYTHDSMGFKIWHRHVCGRLVSFNMQKSASRNEDVKKFIANLKNECREDREYLEHINKLVERNINDDNQVVNWGNRWSCIKQVSTGRNCGILRLSLPECFSSDFETLKLHPALLDVATSVLATKFAKNNNYLPSKYQGVTIFAPLQQDIISYVELFDINPESVNCRLVITDINDNPLVQIKRFTMAAIEVTEKIENPSYSETKNLEFIFGDNKLRHALTPIEGVEVFKRTIDCEPKHILISKTALKGRIVANNTIENIKGALDKAPPNLSGPGEAIHSIWCSLFGYEKIDENDNFFEIGGNSLLAVMLRNRINKELNTSLSIVDIFTYSTIKKLNTYIFGDQQRGNTTYEKIHIETDAIAVIGYSGNFPNSDDIDTFWDNITKRRDCLSRLGYDECTKLRIPGPILNDRDYVASGAIFPNLDKFDAQFWKLSPHDASIMDPQTRQFLEHAWKALEVSGYILQRKKLAVGIFCGSGWSQYLVKNLFANQAIIDKTTAFELNTLGDKDFLATQAAYILDLHGPVINIDTACSTSLVAIAEGCEKLQSNKCDLALAGGVNLVSPDQFGYCYKEGGIYSKDGYCRVFDSEASGTVISGGVGVVVLKRLSEATRDNDNILAVVKGYRINNDGGRKVGFTAPSMLGQKECIVEAQKIAGISSDDISYVECHGTGTLIGDPIEVQALTEAFRQNARGHRVDKCTLGSVKANIGHANKAAGVASFIKVCEMLKRKIIPASINYLNPNPELTLEASPFEIITETRPWDVPGGKRRIAGVSSFGIGGTNAHVILEEPPPQKPSTDSKNTFKLLCLSAKSNESLRGIEEQLGEFLSNNLELNLADVAYTLQVGRESFPHKCLIVCKEVDEAIKELSEVRSIEKLTDVNETKPRNLIFMFSGQGTQYVNMGKQLYLTNKVFKNAIDTCAEILQLYGGYDVRAILYPAQTTFKDAEEKLNNTRFTQPALFVLEYALYKLWDSLKIKPLGLIGHSLGEYAAACVSGIFSLEDALKLVDARGRLIAELPLGSMLAVGQAHELIEKVISNNIALAAINTKNSCVLSGPTDQIRELAKQFKDEGIFCHILQTSHAFHSAMMEPMLSSFMEVLEKVTFNAPTIPLISNITGTWLTAKEAQSKEYWVKHVRETVNFTQGLTELFKIKDAILLEVGPGSTLANLASQHHIENTSCKILMSLPQARDVENSEKYFFTSFGKLWLNGCELNFEKLYNGAESRNKIPLPTYIFDKHRHWVEPDKIHVSQIPPQQTIKAPIEDWFYVPSWKRLPLDNAKTEVINKKILIFKDDFGIGDKLVSVLQPNNDVYTVSIGAGFEFDPANKAYTISASLKTDYEMVFSNLNAKQISLDQVVHLWLLENDDALDQNEVTEDRITHYQELGFYSVLFLIQELSHFRTNTPLNLTVVGNGIYSVTGKENLHPEKATMQGLIKCIPQEYSHIICKYIDVESENLPESLVHNIIAEMLHSKNSIVAYRNQYRWLEGYESIYLSAANTTPGMLKKNGTYLITGGLGGIGLILAEFLAKHLNANLILVSRTNLPDVSQWQDYLAKTDVNDDIAQKIRSILALEYLGASVYHLCADVCSYSDVDQAKNYAENKFGKVNGVFHCAGVPGGKLLCHNEYERIAKIMAPKLIGTLNLYKSFKDADLDVLMLFSSTMSIKCRIGQADYAGANAFLDSFSHYSGMHSVISVNWDVWHNVGMTEKSVQDSFVGIYPLEGVEVLKKLLNKRIDAQVIVSTSRSLLLESNAQIENIEESHKETMMDMVSELSKENLEKHIVGIWQDILGHDEINLNENFFNLGGTSLKIIKMKEKIEEVISSNLKVTDYFNYSTINLLVQKLTEDQNLHVQPHEKKLINDKMDRINNLRNMRTDNS